MPLAEVDRPLVSPLDAKQIVADTLPESAVQGDRASGGVGDDKPDETDIAVGAVVQCVEMSPVNIDRRIAEPLSNPLKHCAACAIGNGN